MIKLTLDQEQEICTKYLSGLAGTTICKDYGVSDTKIYSILDKYSIEKRSNHQSKLSDEDQYNVYLEYMNTKNTCEICNKYKITDAIVRKYVRKFGGIIRDKSECKRKYEINQTYFDNIDTNDKCYFFGLLMADGSTPRTDYTIKINLVYTDKCILEHLTSIIQKDKPLQYVSAPISNFKNVKPQYSMIINSKHMRASLMKSGFVTNKSKELLFPTWIIDSPYCHDFIRGYFDGNGSISLVKNKKGIITGANCEIASTRDFCNKLKSHLEGVLGITLKITKTNPNSDDDNQTLYCTKKNDIYLWLDYMYSSTGGLHIPRKYDKYIQLKTSLDN